VRKGVELYSHLGRYREIFQVFASHGFTHIVQLDALQKALRLRGSDIKKGQTLDRKALAVASEFRQSLEELGPTFVKFGQILSSRRDLVNDEFYFELQKLQEDVKSFSGKEAIRIVERELERPLNRIFKSFDEEPVAAASMAQVHQAELRNGDIVAVKVQRPDIQDTIEQDLAILTNLASLIETHVEQLAALDPVGIIKEFGKTIRNELDFELEAQNMERFARQFQGNRTILVPHVYREFTTARVLTMEYISGYDIDDPEELRENGIDPAELSRKISRLIYRQMFEHGFFHGDPHPGNITVLPGGVTGLYDYGMMGILSPTFRTNVANLILGLAERENHKVMISLIGMSEKGYAEEPGKLETDVEAFVEFHLNKPLKDLKLGFVLSRLLDMLRSHKLRMKPSFYLGVKALSQVEDIGTRLNPDLNFVKLGEPFAQKAIDSKYTLERFSLNLRNFMTAGLDILEELPTDLKEFYERFKHGRHVIPIEHRIDPEGYQPLRSTLNHIANRLTNAIVTAALLVCSSIIILAGSKGGWNGTTLIGMIGLAFGLFLTIRLFYSIHKRGGL
jgi:ubiquinone biosynthesis protein